MIHSRRLTTFFLVIFLAIGLLAGWVTYYLFLKSVVTQPTGYVYNLKAGTSKKLFISQLSQQGIIRYPRIFTLYIYPQPKAQLKTGEYLFPHNATLSSIWKQVTTGTGVVYHSFTIIPGWTFEQIKQALAQKKDLKHIVGDDNQAVMTLLGHPTLSPEGEFFPETYYYTKDSLDMVILQRAFNLMQTRLNAAWQNHAANLPYKNAYEALIAASLIEKEAHLDAERPVISGVIVNRLQKDMLLQIDPTVIYGLGKRYDGKIHKADLVENTPYNTYVHKGLPPTPIAIPSSDSLDAAMHPQVNDYLYFVAKGDGSHQFSATLMQHDLAVAAMIDKVRPTFFNADKIRRYINNVFAAKLLVNPT